MTFHPKYIAMLVPPALLVALVVTVRLAWRAGARGRAFAAGWAALFYGWTLVITLSAHCVEVLVNLARGRSVVGDTPLAYGWRVYSLLLFGATLVALGVACLRAGRRVLGGDAHAAGDVLRAVALVLAVVLPTVPFDPFLGLGIGGAGAVTAAAAALPRMRAGRGRTSGRAPSGVLAVAD
jgi:hypothetical protein